MVRPMWDTAIKYFGSQLGIERAIGIRQSSISYRVVRDLPIPAEWALLMEAASDGELTRTDLRPDLWPAESSR